MGGQRGARRCVNLWWIGGLWLAIVAAGLPAAVRGEDLSAEQREQLFAELHDDVAALERQGNLLKRVVRLVKPTVVHIAARKVSANSGFAVNSLEEAGSGVIVDIGGRAYVLTNRHVINEAPLRSIDIRLADGDLLHPTNVWTDQRTDVAVMEVASSRKLITARLGDSQQVEIGDFVLAVGSPFGLSHSVTYGIISAKGRRDLDLGDRNIFYQDFIQTDAAINPGNSGGPLLNLRGEVIGMNTAIASSSGGNEGIGFTMPVNMAITVARQLVQHGRPLRAYLGVNLNPNFGPQEARRLGLARRRGALVRSVTGDSPAAEAGLLPDDVVIEFDGYRIEDDDHLIKVVGFTPIGKEVDLVVFRRGGTLTLQVVVADRSQFEREE